MRVGPLHQCTVRRPVRQQRASVRAAALLQCTLQRRYGAVGAAEQAAADADFNGAHSGYVKAQVKASGRQLGSRLHAEFSLAIH